MIGRVTSQQILANSTININTAKSTLAKLQAQASSGNAISKPSDDPAGTAASLAVRGSIAANTQYGNNISDGISWLATADSSLSSSESLIQKASDLVVQGANGTMSSTDKEAIAQQLDGIKSDLLAQANTQYNGRSVFAGNSDAAQVFNTSTYAYNGTAGSGTQRRINASETVTVSADGAAAFGTGSSSVFAAIDAATTALRTGTSADVTASLTGLKTSLTNMTAQHAVIGANYSRLDTAKSQNLTDATTLETQRSGIEDIDVAKVTLELSTQNVAYQAALSATAKAIQPTLLSFLS